MHGMFEAARQELFLQIHRQESRAGVDCLVASHGVSLNSTSGWSLVIPYGSRHDAGMNTIFLQRRCKTFILSSSARRLLRSYVPEQTRHVELLGERGVFPNWPK